VTVRPVRVAAALLGLSVAPAAAQGDHGMAADAALGFPQFAGEADLRLYGVGTHRASDRRLRGGDVFLRGEVAGGLHLAPGLSIQGLIHIEPVGEVEPNGGLVTNRAAK
jgi:hypothetical protein